MQPCCALAMCRGVQRRTKAQVQPAMEGVLDSKCEGAAWWELRRRRFERIPVHGTCSARRFEASLMRHGGQFLRLHWRIWRDRNNGGRASLDLAARSIHAHSTDRAILCHAAAAIGLARLPCAQQAGRRRHRGPEDHNRQHCHRALSAPIHGATTPNLYCKPPLPGFLRQ